MEESFDFTVLTKYLEECLINDGKDIDIVAFCKAFDQLNKFIYGLGKVFYFVIKDVNAKLKQLRALDPALQTQKALVNSDADTKTKNGKYPHDIASRSLLRLHRAMLMLITLIEKLAEDNSDSMWDITRNAYQISMYPYHTALVRKSVVIAIKFLKPKEQFLDTIVELQSQAAITDRSFSLDNKEGLRNYLSVYTVPVGRQVYSSMRDLFSTQEYFEWQ